MGATNARNDQSLGAPKTVEFAHSCNVWFHRFLSGTLECMTDVTNILGQIEDGDPSAAENLLPLVYEELRKLATQKLSLEKPGQTLQATALVHEAYLRLVGGNQPGSAWENRGHFFAAAAESMRRILVDQARRKNTQRKGGEFHKIELSQIEPVFVDSDAELDLLALDQALKKLELIAPRKAELVKLRFFAGLSGHQAAAALGIAASTADLDWAYAKSWLKLEMSRTD